MTKDQHVPFVPGAVLLLRDETAGLEPGYYVFIEEQKAQMVVRRIEEDAHGDLVRGDVTRRVHVDYREAFKATGVNIAVGPQ